MLLSSATTGSSFPNPWHHHPAVQHALAHQHVVCLYHWQVPASQHAQLPQLCQAVANGQTLGTQHAPTLQRLAAHMAHSVALEADPPSAEGGTLNVRFAIAFPLGVVQSDLGTLQAVAFGKISMAGALRWQDVAVPPEWASHWAGPRFGAAGLRALVKAPPGQPLLMAIFKPCLGESPEALAQALYHQGVAGTHLVKDDEVLSDPDENSALRRLEACLKALDKAEAETGHRPLYALNLTGPAHTLLPRAQRLAAAGANAFLFNYLCYGLPTLAALASQLPQAVPLIAHPALGGAFYGSPHHGLSPQLLFGTLPRLAGADAVLFPSPYGKVCLPKADALAVVAALRSPHLPVKTAFGVPSAGISPSMVPALLEDFGPEVIVNAGTGIMEAPNGPVAGAHAFLQQWQ